MGLATETSRKAEYLSAEAREQQKLADTAEYLAIFQLTELVVLTQQVAMMQYSQVMLVALLLVLMITFNLLLSTMAGLLAVISLGSLAAIWMGLSMFVIRTAAEKVKDRQHEQQIAFVSRFGIRKGKE